MPNLPNVPLICPLYLDPSDSAASSMTATPYLSQTSISSSILADCPYKFTITTAFGSLPFESYALNAFSKAAGDMFQLSKSESIKTGAAPRYKIGLALATNVNEEQNTMS